MRTLNTFLAFIFSIILATAQEGYPRPTEKDVIFYIQHNRGKNTFTYQPNFTQKGLLNEENPILAKRQIFDNKGEIKNLTSIQKRYAYGIKSTKISKNTFDIRLVSYDEQALILKLDKNNKPYIETTINGQYMIVKQLFLQQKEGTGGLKTEIDYILFIGNDKNGKGIRTKLIP